MNLELIEGFSRGTRKQFVVPKGRRDAGAQSGLNAVDGRDAESSMGPPFVQPM